jgi:hypothetical protein
VTEPQFARKRERPRPHGQSEQDDDEIDKRLDRHMGEKRQATKRRCERHVDQEDFERGQRAANDRARQHAARNGPERQLLAAFRSRGEGRIDRADRRGDDSEPGDEPEFARQLGKRHRNAVALMGSRNLVARVIQNEG